MSGRGERGGGRDGRYNMSERWEGGGGRDGWKVKYIGEPGEGEGIICWWGGRGGGSYNMLGVEGSKEGK